ncbi:MAG: hypothetical protein RLZZ299_128 [Pseudomonadota bacterium]|jgi:hypothetical protein
MSVAVAALLTRLDALAWRLEQGASVDPAELQAVADAVDAVDRGDRVAVGVLHDRLTHFNRVLGAARDRLAARIGEAGRGRRAVRAYHSGERG